MFIAGYCLNVSFDTALLAFRPKRTIVVDLVGTRRKNEHCMILLVTAYLSLRDITFSSETNIVGNVA